MEAKAEVRQAALLEVRGLKKDVDYRRVYSMARNSALRAIPSANFAKANSFSNPIFVPITNPIIANRITNTIANPIYSQFFKDARDVYAREYHAKILPNSPLLTKNEVANIVTNILLSTEFEFCEQFSLADAVRSGLLSLYIGTTFRMLHEESFRCEG